MTALGLFLALQCFPWPASQVPGEQGLRASWAQVKYYAHGFLTPQSRASDLLALSARGLGGLSLSVKDNSGLPCTEWFETQFLA